MSSIKLKKISSTEKTLTALLGVVLFFSLAPSALVEAEVPGVKLYVDPGLTGDYITLTADYPDLSSLGYEDRISSLEIIGDCDVRLFEDRDYKGAHVCFKEGQIELKDIKLSDTDSWDDKLSSIKILADDSCEQPGITLEGETIQWCPGCDEWWNPFDWQTCMGCLANTAFSAPIWIPSLFLVVIIGLLSLILGGLFCAVTGLLGWVKTICLQVPIIHAPIVDLGWTFSRDFVNMLFILILVFIGLATILRIESYQLKKTLPSLLLIALLVNFSLVLVGFVVDISNIVTNFFLSQIVSWDNLLGTWNNALDFLVEGAHGVLAASATFYSGFGLAISRIVGIVVYGIVLCIFYLGAIIVYLTTVFLLFFRIIALWVLAILAPFAFFCYILPKTKPAWNMWWKNLFQWSIIGIPLGFFLYLSNYLIGPGADVENLFATSTLSSSVSQASASPTTGVVINSLLANILTPTVSLVFLAMGVLIALKTAPAGADFVMKGGKLAGAWIMRRQPVRALAGGLAGGTSKVLEGMEEKTRLAERFAIRFAMKGKTPFRRGLRGAVASPFLVAARGLITGTRMTRMATEPYLTPFAAKMRKTPLPPNWDTMSSKERERIIGLATGSDKLNLAWEAWRDHQSIKHMHKVLKALPLLIKKHSGNAAVALQIADLSDYYLKAVTKDSELAYAQATGGKDERKKLEEEINKVKNSVIGPEIEKLSKDEIVKLIKVKYDIDENEVRNKFKEYKKKYIEDEAAVYLHLKGFDTSDWRNTHKSSIKDSVAASILSQEVDHSVVRAIKENFEPSVFDKWVNGPGGLNRIFKEAKDEEKLNVMVKLFAKNESLVRWLMVNPTGKAIEWEGRGIIEKEGGLEKFLEEHLDEIEDIRKKEKEYEEGLKKFEKAAERVEKAMKKKTRRERMKEKLGDTGEKIKEIKKRGLFRPKRGTGKGEIPDTGKRE